MTPKEKAEQLVDSYLNELNQIDRLLLFTAKQCALICVDEIQNTKSVYVNDVEYGYYEEVKQEIQLL
jgi:hypothetical protein